MAGDDPITTRDYSASFYGFGTVLKGVAGTPGATGPQGEPGPQGIPGPSPTTSQLNEAASLALALNPPKQGERGIAATIRIGTVSTGDAGTLATFTNSGSATDAVFDIQLPRGYQGIQGVQGPQGIQGVKGDKGDTGSVSNMLASDVTTALGYTPYNAANPAGYISGITSAMVTGALGYTPANKAGETFTNTVSAGTLVGRGTVVAAGVSGGEGGQIVLGYAGNTSLGGQAPSSWNIDVDASSNLRVFQARSDASIRYGFTINEGTGVTNFLQAPTVGGNPVWYPGNLTPLDLNLGGTAKATITIRNAAPEFHVNGTGTTNDAGYNYLRNDTVRWVMGDSITNDLWYLNRFDNSGGFAGTPIQVRRSDGKITMGDTTVSSLTAQKVYAQSNGDGKAVQIGDDAWIGDINVGNCIGISGLQDASKGYIAFGSDKTQKLGRSGTGYLTWDGDLAVGNWIRPLGPSGIFWETYQRGINAPDASGAQHGNVNVYGAGLNGWRGYAINTDVCFMTDSTTWGFYSDKMGTWQMQSDFSGNVTFLNNVTAYSDRRLKTNIRTIGDALTRLKRLRGVSYLRDGRPKIGVIAQEVEEVFPEVVLTGSDPQGLKSVAYGDLVGVLIEAVKDLSAEVSALKKAQNL